MVIVAVDGDGDERRKKMVTSERRDKLKGEMGKGQRELGIWGVKFGELGDFFCYNLRENWCDLRLTRLEWRFNLNPSNSGFCRPGQSYYPNPNFNLLLELLSGSGKPCILLEFPNFVHFSNFLLCHQHIWLNRHVGVQFQISHTHFI